MSIPIASSGAYGFFGLSSPAGLTSMTIDPTFNFLNMANFYVSAVPVPELGTVGLLLLGGSSALFLRFRKRG